MSNRTFGPSGEIISKVAPNNQASSFNSTADSILQDDNEYLKTGVVKTNVNDYPLTEKNALAVRASGAVAIGNFNIVVSLCSDGTNIYALQGNVVVKLDATTNKWDGEGGFSLPEMSQPAGITYYDGNFYVIEGASGATEGLVYKYDSSGNFLFTHFKASSSYVINDISFNDSALRFIVIFDDGANTRAITYSLNGTVDENVLVGTSLQVGSVGYDAGYWYFADTASSGSIRKFNVTTWADGGTSAFNNSTDGHRGIVGHGGSLYVSPFNGARELEKRATGLGYTSTIADALPTDMGVAPKGFVWDGTSYWSIDGDKFMYEVDSAGLPTGTSSDLSTPIEGTPTDMTWDGTYYWILDNLKLYRVNSSQVYTDVFVTVTGTTVTSTTTKLFVASTGTVTVIDTATMEIESVIELNPDKVITMSFYDGNNIWLGDEEMYEYTPAVVGTGRYLDFWNHISGSTQTADYKDGEWMLQSDSAATFGTITSIVGEKRVYIDSDTEYPIYIKVQ